MQLIFIVINHFNFECSLFYAGIPFTLNSLPQELNRFPIRCNSVMDELSRCIKQCLPHCQCQSMRKRKRKDRPISDTEGFTTRSTEVVLLFQHSCRDDEMVTFVETFYLIPTKDILLRMNSDLCPLIEPWSETNDQSQHCAK